MSLLSSLPTLEGAKVIVVDEESEVKYGESLIMAWLSIWKAKDERNIELLCFSGPKSSSKIYSNSLKKFDVKVHDYYTLGLEKIDPLNDKKLWEILEINLLKRNSTIIIDSLSLLLLYKSLAEVCKFLDKLKEHVAQVVCIYQRDFGHSKIPSIKTLGTSYVRLEPTRGLTTDYNLSYKTLMSHCKPGGSILQKIEIVEQNINSYELKTEELKIQTDQKDSIVNLETANKIQASFRIEINNREMEQRKATPLPYTLQNLTSTESKIHYEPDEIDDLDEEDPDDDLDF